RRGPVARGAPIAAAGADLGGLAQGPEPGPARPVARRDRVPPPSHRRPVMDTQKGLVFKYKNMHTVEVFPLDELEGKTFDQMAVELWDRLRRKPGTPVPLPQTDFPTPQRYPVKFSWQPPGGEVTYIGGASNVLAFVARTGA